MTVSDVIAYYKTPTNFSKQCNISRGALYEWKQKAYIPYKSQLKLERLTEGLLKADIADIPFNKQTI